VLADRQMEKSHASALEHGSQLVTGGIYRKLLWESHKKVENNIDISPRICMTFVLIIMLVVSLC